MGGFIGPPKNGVTSTLGRGGSDFTASIVGAGVNAEEIQIWTDVDGMLTADPTIFPGGHRVKTISFAEAAELAYFGAKVLHPATVIPAMERNIPVLILNSRRPEVPGTRSSRSGALPQRGQVDRLQAQDHAGQYPFQPHVHGAWISAPHLRNFRPLRDVGGYDRDQRSQRVAHHRQHGAWTGICEELSEFSEVSTEPDQAIVCLVGENIRYTPGVASRVFNRWRRQHPHDFAGSVAAESERRGGGERSAHGRRSAAYGVLPELDPEVFE
jgi:aspartate kinase